MPSKNNANFEIPVSIFIFNRPEHTKSLMTVLQYIQPSKLLVVADGPRREKIGEKELCEEARNIALDINWECDVLVNFSEENLGCKARVSSGLDWVFSQVEKSIILEDDCVPDFSFFEFLKLMLNHFEHNNQIGMISGDNYLFGLAKPKESYYFSQYPHIWGWATWSDRWKLYDLSMQDWKALSPEAKSSWLNSISFTKAEKRNWTRIFDAVANDQIDTWDYQWVYTMFKHHLLSVVPKTNLVSNTGFGGDATHTKTINLSGTLGRGELFFPLNHPVGPISSNIKLDRIESRILLTNSVLARSVRRALAILISSFRSKH